MIRRISIGPDYKDAMHFQVGQRFAGSPNSPYKTITAIIKNQLGEYEIWVKDGSGEFIWKVICNMPVVIEKDIDGF